MPLKPLFPSYLDLGVRPALYDDESMTVIESEAEVRRRVSECINEFNTLEENVKDIDNKKLSKEEYLNDIRNIRKIDDTGNFTGSWHGFDRPEQSEPGIQNQVKKNREDIEKIKKIVMQIPIEDFGGKGDSITDNSDAFTNAINYINSLPLNENVEYYITHNNGEYLYSKPVNIKNTNIYIEGKGTILNGINTNEVMWTFTNTVNEIKEVTNIADTIIDCDTTNLNKYDIVRIYSDDLFTGNRFTSRHGEYARIKNIISPTQLELESPLVFSYTSYIKITKIGGNTCKIKGLTFDMASTQYSKDYIKIIGMNKPRLQNLKCNKGSSAFILTVGCYNPIIDNITVENLENDGQLRFGYGVADTGSYLGQLNNSVFINVRHGFTTGSSNLVEIPYTFGETLFFDINNCYGFSNTTASFDTHENGFFINFNDCHDYNSKIGFQARNNYCRFNNCTSDKSKIGWNIFNYSGTSNANNIELNDCKTNVRENSIIIQALNNTQSPTNISIQNCNLICNTDFGINCISCSNLLIRNSYIKTNNDVSIALRKGRIDCQNTYVESKAYAFMQYGTSEIYSINITHKPTGENAYVNRSADQVSGKTFITRDMNILNDTFNKDSASIIGNKSMFTNIETSYLKNYKTIV